MSVRQIEVFSAGCGLCEDTIRLVHEIAAPASEIQILDMKNEAVAERARALGIRRVPAVVVDGKLAGCCGSNGPTEEGLRAAGVGS